MSFKFDQILEELPRLSQKQLGEIATRTSYLLSSASEDEAPDWITAGIMAELKARGLVKNVHSYRHFLPKNYAAKAVEVEETLINTNELRSFFTPPRKYVLGRVAACALADYLSWMKSFGPHIMFARVLAIPEALEASFPGYLGAGRLDILVGKDQL